LTAPGDSDDTRPDMQTVSSITILRPGALLSLVLLVGGCAVPPIKSAATVKATGLPEKAPELIQYADAIYVKSMATAGDGSADMENALVALDKAVKLEPTSYEAAWKAARACAWLAEDLFDSDKTKCAHFSGRGADYAKAAVKANANGVEGHYYDGINSALNATTRLWVTAKFMVPAIRDTWKKAMQLDATFDHGGPPRALGSLYAHAPPWPASIGDPEMGVKLLKKALEIAPDYPQNALLFGDALVADEQYEEAQRQYHKVLEAQPQPDYAHFLSKWKQKAQKGLEKADKKLREAGSS
jgi:tetratricopeptide (TPR) repeat protein